MNLIELTAVAALLNAYHSPSGLTNEHGGMIYNHPTNAGIVVEYVEPTPEGDPTSVTVIDRKMLKARDGTLLATYHVHLCLEGYYHAYFSVADVMVAIFSGVPEFMLDECTGDIHEFDPKVDKIRGPGGIDGHIFGSNGEKLDRHLPGGRIIKNIGETQPMHEIVP